MYAVISSVLGATTDFVAAVLWFLPRTLMCFTVFPLFSQTLTAPFIRNAAAVAFAMIPATFYFQSVDHHHRPFLEVGFFALREVTIGLMLGFTITFPYFAFRAFGAFIDAWRGATFATLIDPTSGGDELVTEKLMQYAFTMLFISGPTLVLSVQALYDSFLLLPPGTTELGSLKVWIDLITSLFSYYVTYALVLSGPVFIAVILIETALSIISVYAPSLQVYSIDAAVKTVFALAILVAMFEFAADDILKMTTSNIEQVAKILSQKVMR